MLQQSIRRSLTALFRQKNHSRLAAETPETARDFKRITREEIQTLTTKELQKRAIYESLAEHQRLIDAENKASRLWQS